MSALISLTEKLDKIQLRGKKMLGFVEQQRQTHRHRSVKHINLSLISIIQDLSKISLDTSIKQYIIFLCLKFLSIYMYM